MIVAVSGSRNLTNRLEVIAALDKGFRELSADISASVLNHELTLLTGGCNRGVDIIVGRWALEKGIALRTMPARWDLYGRAAGPMRNREMVEESDVLVAIWDGKSSGTAGTVRMAKVKGIPFVVVDPIGPRRARWYES